MSRRGIFVLVASITSCVVLVLITIVTRRTPAERVCHNLISAGHYNDESECVLIGYPSDYMGAMFPLHEVDIDYVRAGMDGFKVDWEKRSDTGGTVVVYHLKGFLIGQEFFKFGFDKNGTLVSTQWQN